jgi:hypothetical protein
MATNNTTLDIEKSANFYLIKNGGGLQFIKSKEGLKQYIAKEGIDFVFNFFKVYYINFGLKPKFELINKINLKKFNI